MEKKKGIRDYLGKAVGFIPLILVVLIIFLARESFIENMKGWGVEKPKGEGPPLLEKQMFVRDRYHRRDITNPDRVVKLDRATLYQQTFTGEDMSVTETKIELANGDIFQHTMIPHSEYLAGYNKYKLVIHYEFKRGWVTYFDPEKQEWVYNKRLRGGISFPTNMAFINIENETYLVLDQTYAYSDGRDGNVIARDDAMGRIFVSHRGYGFDFLIGYAMEEGVHSEMWTLESKEPLVDLENLEATLATGETSREFWERCSYGQNHRFLLGGYYSRTPESYSGYEENAFWRNPGVHIPYNYILYGNDRASYDLGYVQLYLSSLNMEKDGYFKTEPESAWLREAYGMRGGYYDTRFNADMGVALVKAYAKYDEPFFLEQAKRMLAFYKKFAAENHYAFYKDGNDEGWLVQDYWHPDGGYEPVHSALNHQMQEMIFLYSTGEILGDEEAIALADTLLKGIEMTCDIWVKPGGDLHYGYTPEGTFDRQDYPELTYNDMIRLKEQLAAMGRGQNECLERLIRAKKQFMDAEGITNYLH